MSSVSSCVLGLLLVLAAPVCAVAQTDWQTPSTGGTGYNGGYSPAGTLPIGPAQPPRPFDDTSGLPRPTYPPADQAVVRADYETAVPPAPAESRFNAPSASADSLGSMDGTTGPADLRAQPVQDHQRLTRGAKSSRLLPRGGPSQASRGSAEGLGRVWTTGAALALVLGLFCVVAWLMRRAVPKTTLPLPTEVVETLGRAPLAGRQCVHLVRCGRKLLLVSVTPDRATTLTEITDPIEVDRLAGLCDRSRGGSAAAAFRQVFEQFSHTSRRPLTDDRDVAAGSYFDDDRPSFREGRDV